jgi:ABC-type lipoprotein release transport system permease subunit
MILLRLALRNLLGAGLRTWLNVLVLSFAYVAIVWTQGLLEGMNQQAANAMVETEYAGGQYWHEAYDPFDLFSLDDAHGAVPEPLRTLVERGDAAPILIVQGSIYPEGRMRPALLKGIDPGQTVLSLPSSFLEEERDPLPILIGGRMARSTGIRTGDRVTVQWRDVNGTFDALDAEVVHVMNTSVPTVDNGQVWLPLSRLQRMAELAGEATLVVVSGGVQEPPQIPGWTFRGLDFLLEDIRTLVQSKTAGSAILYFILLFLAMIAIFDTQVLSVFRRRKEMGTLMSLGMTRGKVIALFTLEGAMHGVLAAVLAAIYGIPLLTHLARTGWALPVTTDSYGFAIGERLFPVYGAKLVILTIAIVLVMTTIVSYLPTRRISRLKPTDALRGRMT